MAASYGYSDGYRYDSRSVQSNFYALPPVQRPGYVCLYFGVSGECMVEQYYYEEQYVRPYGDYQRYDRYDRYDDYEDCIDRFGEDDYDCMYDDRYDDRYYYEDEDDDEYDEDDEYDDEDDDEYEDDDDDD